MEKLSDASNVTAVSLKKSFEASLDLLLPRKSNSRYHPKHSFNRAFSNLIKQGIITLENRGNKKLPRLTPKGKELLLKYRVGDLKIEKPKRWDGKWRLIIFDIKEARRNVRDSLRDEITNLGFLKLQNSVWVIPYDCRELAIMLKSHFKIGRDVLYLVVDHIENDRWLREEFEI